MQHPYPVTDPLQAIPARFEQMARLYAERDAIRFEETSMTYAALSKESDRLARQIIRAAGEGKGRIGIYIEHGLYQPLAIMGILKAGKAYVALDPTFNVERNVLMLKAAECQLLVTNNKNISQAKSFSSPMPVISIDQMEDSDDWQDLPVTDPEQEAFVTFTSGSTGIPKGVIHTHANMLHFIMRMYHVGCTMPDDRWAYYYSIAFSAHAMPILGALLNGASLCIFDLKKDNFGSFSKWLRQEKISISLMIPSILRQFTATLGSGRRFPKLGRLLIGGETLYRSDVEKIREHMKEGAVIYNIYASSEAYLARAYRIESDTVIKGNNVPIGHEVPGMEVSILDDQGQRCDPYKTGEITITSRFLSTGYLPQEGLTDNPFTYNDDGTRTFRSNDMGHKLSDGCIVHVGRNDAVVKLRGYRIDLGEIENTMMELKQVKEVAVVVKENMFGTKQLIAYYVERENAGLDPHYLKLSVIRNLPDYMVPAYYIKLDHLPKNDIGKTDYRQLPEPDWTALTSRKDVEAPSNGIEEELKEIFERILEVSPLGVTDNIMEAGADSLRLFVAFDEVEKRFGKKLNIDAIIEAPRIRDIARQIEE